MADNWVEFKTVKAAVSMRKVLAHYEVVWLRPQKERELRGRCPICKSKDDNPFSANMEKNNFQCFSCKAHGNVLDFVAAMEKCSVRDAALKLASWFGVGGDCGTVSEAVSKTSSQLATEKDQAPGPPQDLKTEEKTKPVESGGVTAAENKPLTFQLHGVDPAHGYISERGITPETAAEFGIGFFPGKGSMSGRVVIPIHNERGELLAYAGRSIDGSEPRYKFPPGFHKAAVLFNLHRVETAREVVLVEGFFDCMKVWQSGFAPVALMGCSLSEQQERLLGERFSVAVLLLDGDEEGKRATDECLLRLGRRMWVKAVVVPQRKQPDQLEPDELRGLLR